MVIVVGSTRTTGSACAGEEVDGDGRGDGGAQGGAGAGDTIAGAGADTGAGAGAGDGGTPGACSTQGFGLAAFCGGFGVTSARHDERGANTRSLRSLWYLTSGIRGGGINPASLAMHSIGAMARWVRPRGGTLDCSAGRSTSRSGWRTLTK
jgi:hypothetical protein